MCKYALMICALMAAGCTQQTSAPLRVKMQDSSLYVGADQGIGTGDLMEVAEDVLAGMYFTIEKADAQNGLIRTRPLPGAQFFEFWRSDNIGTDNTIAANLHTIRRTVTLDISQQDRSCVSAAKCRPKGCRCPSAKSAAAPGSTGCSREAAHHCRD